MISGPRITDWMNEHEHEQEDLRIDVTVGLCSWQSGDRIECGHQRRNFITSAYDWGESASCCTPDEL